MGRQPIKGNPFYTRIIGFIITMKSYFEMLSWETVSLGSD